MRWIGPLLLILSLAACGGGGAALAPIGAYDSSSRKVTKPPAYYKVRKGDTLFSISWRYGLDYKDVARMNGIRSPYTIYVGQKLSFNSKYKATTRPAKSNTASSPSTPSKQARPTSGQSKPAATPAYTGNQNLRWRWPTNGKVISTYSNSSAGRKGIDISGSRGQAIYAAASGKVVYSGNGLARYGNLLIIKHNDVYLSAYAHNDKLLVKEGQVVKAGQKIATLGNTGTQKTKLHFEIRRNGKPVDPMRFLPKQ
ncbi:MAG TPA: LysM peptidoglycan-binding domain-containing protein [Methylophaga aminisulfidivorans]|uniref:LysM peptidoglycan-binding domain-containing protein n=1 Tax=Methylophaga aminisulfidivorans TaxID=230105 RepID=A0A7C2ANB9_9GAMM|nr:LysM peptidoglycan-binding domain-containing protein [Methylophaga aminisulfidivorans]